MQQPTLGRVVIALLAPPSQHSQLSTEHAAIITRVGPGPVPFQPVDGSQPFECWMVDATVLPPNSKELYPLGAVYLFPSLAIAREQIGRAGFGTACVAWPDRVP